MTTAIESVQSRTSPAATAIESRRRMVKVQKNTEWNRVPPLQRYEVDHESGCWIWRGCIQSHGYGHIQVNKQRFSAHRYFFLNLRGPVPDGLFLCHKCDNPRCVNPDHIFLGTGKDNANDMVEKGRSKKGESHVFAKLTNEQVKRIFVDTREDWIVAQEHGVSSSLVCQIHRGKIWRHVTSEIGEIPPRRKTGPRKKHKNPTT